MPGAAGAPGGAPGAHGAPGAQQTAYRELSGREVEVLRLVAEGQSNKAIGVAMGLSALTVKSHLARIARKLGTGDRAGDGRGRAAHRHHPLSPGAAAAAQEERFLPGRRAPRPGTPCGARPESPGRAPSSV